MGNKDIIHGVFTGKYTTRKLPKSYYREVSGNLVGMVEKGIGGDKAYDALLQSLTDNAQAFAGAKTYQMVGELQLAAGAAKKFADYEPVAHAIYNKYKSWSEAEDNTALQQTLQAKQWEIIEADKDLFPILVYRTIGDACRICKPLDGFAARVGDPAWRRIYPVNHYNCYCIVTQEVSGAVALTKKEEARMLVDASGKLIAPVFQSNAGITKQLFTKEHPYFDVPKEDRKFAKENFGLTIK